MIDAEKPIDRRYCLRCGSTQQRLTHHHVIPKSLVKRVGADYWNLYASVTMDWNTLPTSSLLAFQRAAERWVSLPHYTQRFCDKCHEQVHREIGILGKRVWEAQWHQCDSNCDFFECEFWRQFDIGNLFVWFAPESTLSSH